MTKEKTSPQNRQNDLFPTSNSAAIHPEEAQVEASYKALSIDELAQEIQRHDELYFTHATPIISDPLYDKLRDRLTTLAPHHPILTNVGAGPLDVEEGVQTGKVQHKKPMLSLEKTYDIKGIEAWLKRSIKTLKDEQKKQGIDAKKKLNLALLGSHKIDGLACSLRYDKRGRLEIAATRGDGNIGENILQHVQYLENIPLKIDFPNLEVRGEIYMPISVFEQFKEGNSPRNLAAGALKLKDPSAAKKFRLRFFAYNLIMPRQDDERTQTGAEKAAPFDLNTASGQLTFLETLGFESVGHKQFKTPTLAEIESYYKTQTKERMSWDFETDGIVFKFDDSSFDDILGATNHHPKSAIAYKFEGGVKNAELYTVEWQIARTGVITPLAIFEGVQLSGAVIQRASLANYSRFKSMKLRTGDTLMIMRRGGVIPYVSDVFEHDKSNPPIEAPKHCPACGSETLKKPPVLVCSDIEACRGVRKARLEYFVNLLKLKGFGPATIEKLVDYDFSISKNDAKLEPDPFSKPDDLFRLSLEDIALAIGQDNPDAKTAQTLYDNIQSPKRVSLALFLEMLDIPGFDTKLCKTLANDFGTLDALLGTSLSPALKRLRPYIESLRKHIDIEEKKPKKKLKLNTPPAEDRIFAGMRILLLGRIDSLVDPKDGQKLTKAKLTKRLKDYGALVVTTVSENLAVIVTGERIASTKANANPNRLYDEALELAEKNSDILVWAPEEIKEHLQSVGAPIA